MGTAPAFASVSEAMDMVRAGLAFVAAADVTELTTEEQAETLRALERANSVAAAARTSVLGAFTAGKGYAADADYSPRAWLMHQTGITRGATVPHTAWVKRAARHPRLYAAMTAQDISESHARTLCTWTDKLPPEPRGTKTKPRSSTVTAATTAPRPGPGEAPGAAEPRPPSPRPPSITSRPPPTGRLAGSGAR